MLAEVSQFINKNVRESFDRQNFSENLNKVGFWCLFRLRVILVEASVGWLENSHK